MAFADRRDAGRQLARRLAHYAASDPIVVGMPRGGVIVAAEIARELVAALDILVVRKLGFPGQPELGMGAVAEGGVRSINQQLVDESGVSQSQLELVASSEGAELERRVQVYRAGRAPLEIAARTVILVDDGLATGYTARAAIDALRQRGAAKVILALPMAPRDVLESLGRLADAAVALETPEWFFAIGEFYEEFGQTSDSEVIAALQAAADGSYRIPEEADER